MAGGDFTQRGNPPCVKNVASLIERLNGIGLHNWPRPIHWQLDCLGLLLKSFSPRRMPCTLMKKDRFNENQQWEMSAFPCPSCALTMRLVGRERPEQKSKGYLLTFQCDCGQIFSTRSDQ